MSENDVTCGENRIVYDSSLELAVKDVVKNSVTVPLYEEGDVVTGTMLGIVLVLLYDEIHAVRDTMPELWNDNSELVMYVGILVTMDTFAYSIVL